MTREDLADRIFFPTEDTEILKTILCDLCGKKLCDLCGKLFFPQTSRERKLRDKNTVFNPFTFDPMNDIDRKFIQKVNHENMTQLRVVISAMCRPGDRKDR